MYSNYPAQTAKQANELRHGRPRSPRNAALNVKRKAQEKQWAFSVAGPVLNVIEQDQSA